MKKLFRSLLRISLALATTLILIAAILYGLFGMPGFTHRGPLPAWTQDEQQLAARLRHHVEYLATEPHHIQTPAALSRTAAYIEQRLTSLGYAVNNQYFAVGGINVRNIEVVIQGKNRPKEVVIVGAHYDSTDDGPGANDNASGSAALLELAGLLRTSNTEKTIRLVWFVNEEPPYFQGKDMGSVRYAKLAMSRRDEKVQAMLSLETLGYYSDAPQSQKYPHNAMRAFYPDAGNYLAFVGNWQSRDLVSASVKAFRRSTPFPSQGLALPDSIKALEHISDPLGYSDHWSFWQHNVPALMVTDTAMMRYPHYHTAQDTPDKIDYLKLARVTLGLHSVIRELASQASE